MLPKRVYIYREVSSHDDEDRWLVASEDLEGCANRNCFTIVGEYDLKATHEVKLEVATKLVQQKDA